MPDWFESEQFWIDFFPVMFPEERMAKASEEVDAVLTLAKAQRGPVLDLGCGPGRHAVAFASRGYPVTGVDLSAYLLGVARNRAQEAQVAVDFVQEDLRTFVRPAAYRLAVSLFTSFGYFERREDDLRVLRNVHQSLAEGGSFVIDVMGKEVLARRFQPAGVQMHDDGSTLFENRAILDGWDRTRMEWILLRGEEVRRHILELNLYSAHEMKEALRHAGFSGVTVYGDLAGSPYDAEASRLVAVAVK